MSDDGLLIDPLFYEAQSIYPVPAMSLHHYNKATIASKLVIRGWVAE